MGFPVEFKAAFVYDMT